MKGSLVEPGHWRFGKYHAMQVGPKEWQLTKEINLGHRTWVTTKPTLRECREAIREETE